MHLREVIKWSLSRYSDSQFVVFPQGVLGQVFQILQVVISCKILLVLILFRLKLCDIPVSFNFLISLLDMCACCQQLIELFSNTSYWLFNIRRTLSHSKEILFIVLNQWFKLFKSRFGFNRYFFKVIFQGFPILSYAFYKRDDAMVRKMLMRTIFHT